MIAQYRNFNAPKICKITVETILHNIIDLNHNALIFLSIKPNHQICSVVLMLCHSVWCRLALPWLLLCGVHCPVLLLLSGCPLDQPLDSAASPQKVLIRGCFSERFFRYSKVPSVPAQYSSILHLHSVRAIGQSLFHSCFKFVHVCRVPNGCILTVVPRSRYVKSRD